MPRWWRCPQRWQQGCDSNRRLLQSASEVLANGLQECRQSTGRRWSRGLAQWIADAVGWVFVVVAAVILERSVLPGGQVVSGRQQHRERKLDMENCQLWSLRVERAVQQGDTNRSLLYRCYR